MPLDAAKMKSYLSTTEPRPGRKLPVVSSPAKAPAKSKREVFPGMRDALIFGEDVDDAAIGRLLDAGYMELIGKAGGFSCGTCRSYADGECKNEKVLASVSDDHGCCNFWWASDEGDVTFPPTAGA